MENLNQWLQSTFKEGAPMVTMILILGLAALAFIITLIILRRVVTRIVRKTKTVWDDALLESKFFFWLAQLAPGAVFYKFASLFASEPTRIPLAVAKQPGWGAFSQQASKVYMIVVGYLAFSALLSGILEIYQKSSNVPIRGFLQVVKLIAFIVTGIVVLSVALDQSPVYFLSGLGALTAVLMLIFKDSILGLVAGVQLAANRMVSRGDWIEMPKYGADGNVLDVALTTVKVQNWDNTITTIPTYALISDSFKNWRGMQNSGGRRIKRSLLIDISSIRFCDDLLLEQLRKNPKLKDYFAKAKGVTAKDKRLTNVGAFRSYIVYYVRQHKMINQELTVLVRQLSQSDHGVPLEVYVFSKDKNWVNYEAIQSDIFDHLFAILPEFKLRAYQRPSARP
jgi:miniconductance mechanosensitive channel